MSILRLQPAVKDYLWGGDRLKRLWHVETPLDIAAEAWVLSCHPDGPSVVTGGALDGKTLPEALEELGETAVGTNGTASAAFPILIKLIDAKNKLSIQVHPDDDYALAHEGQFGKTESWVILDAEPGAIIYYGFSKEISLEEFKERIRGNTLPDVLNAVPVRPGDVFTIYPGTIHAIGGGVLLAEIQQSSNVTYRVYDYDRRDAAGRPRALHIEQALAVTKRRPPERMPSEGHLASTPFYTVDRLTVAGRAEGTVGADSFLSIVVADGEGTLTTGEEKLSVRRGDSFFLPAGTGHWAMEGSVSALLTALPARRE